MELSTVGLSPSDLDYIFEKTKTLWEDLHDQRLFITGGTGFFGCWLLESFVWANRILQLNATAVILTRHPALFKKKCPHLFAEPSLTFHEGDVKDFKWPEGQFSYMIHAATAVANGLGVENHDLFDSIVQGTTQALAFARQAGVTSFLLISSGAVYGKQPTDISHMGEDYPCSIMAPDSHKSAYALGKRQAEELCRFHAEDYNLDVKIARCFAFVGPHLPLDSQFAIGNFISDGLAQRPIVVKGDGRPYRSYLYAADLAIGLWTILLRGKRLRPYNLGSDEAISIAELARRVANHFDPSVNVQIEQAASASLPERYVPDIRRIRDELGFVPERSLDQAIRSTIHWYRHLG